MVLVDPRASGGSHSPKPSYSKAGHSPEPNLSLATGGSAQTFLDLLARERVPSRSPLQWSHLASSVLNSVQGIWWLRKLLPLNPSGPQTRC